MAVRYSLLYYSCGGLCIDLPGVDLCNSISSRLLYRPAAPKGYVCMALHEVRYPSTMIQYEHIQHTARFSTAVYIYTSVYTHIVSHQCM